MNEPHMLEKFSSLIPNKDFKSWKGYIMHDIYIEVYCPNIPKLDNLEVHMPQLIISNFHQFDLKETVKIVQESTFSLSEFLTEFISILERNWEQHYLSNLYNIKNVYINDKFFAVIKEVNSYSQYIYAMDEHLKHIIFKITDTYKNDHFITIYLQDNYPTVYPLNFESLVPSIIMNSFSKITTISKLFEHFKSVINDLTKFWNIHQEIINTCNVLGVYTFKDVKFKIPIDKYVCVEIEVDPFYPNLCPKFDFHGRPESINKFQQRLNQIDPILIWNTENCYKENILNIFEIDNLQLQYEIDKQEQFDVECLDNNSDYCFICYDQMAIKKQIKSCHNTKCDALYHMSCICEWLLNSGSTPMFDHLQGKCPQCEENMLVALENFNLIKT